MQQLTRKCAPLADLHNLAADFRRHLSATNRSPRTVEIDLKALDQFIAGCLPR